MLKATIVWHKLSNELQFEQNMNNNISLQYVSQNDCFSDGSIVFTTV